MMKSRFKNLIVKKITAVLFTLPIMIMMGRGAMGDDIYDKCMEKMNYDTDAVACARTYYERIEAELDRVWQALLKSKDVNNFEPLDEYSIKRRRILLAALYEEQEKWEEYRKTACQYFTSNEGIDGTFVPIFGSMGTKYAFPACYGRVIEQRIEILRQELCEYEGDEDICS